jgi:hypothetical protein
MNTRNNETFFFDRLLRGRPILVPVDWYLREGLDRRDVDFAHEDALLRR